MSNHVLKVEHITKSYQDGAGENVVLRHVSLNVLRGELIAVVGPSGSEKSIFLNISGAQPFINSLKVNDA